MRLQDGQCVQCGTTLTIAEVYGWDAFGFLLCGPCVDRVIVRPVDDYDRAWVRGLTGAGASRMGDGRRG